MFRMSFWRVWLVLCLCRTGATEVTGKLEPDGAETPLEDETDNQENLLTQLLGDYDKVKSLSEGSDCRCKCVVRPLGRSACRLPGRREKRDPELFHAVLETVASGSDCRKCVCVAPPSALNPCEGEIRLKKLRDAGGKDIKLSKIMDLLEGAFYGMDLLKLHSVTTNLLHRVDAIEKKKYQEKSVGGQNITKLKNNMEEPQNRSRPNDMVIRGVTFYSSMDEDTVVMPKEDESDERPFDLLIDDHPSKHKHTSSFSQTELHISEQHLKDHPQVSSSEQTTPLPATVSERNLTMDEVSVLSTGNLTTTAMIAVQVNIDRSSPTVESEVQGTRVPKVKPQQNLTQNSAEASKVLTTNQPGTCKDTIATIAEPLTHNTYGDKEGAWMKDPTSNGNAIYVTNHYYGDTLLEFSNMETFKQGLVRNSYKLPYSWAGTGHTVYRGALYYNRAFSRDIIRFDLRLRYVAAWSTLHDAVSVGDADFPASWQGHSDIEFAADESGVWLVYPSLDEDGFHAEVITLSRLNPHNLLKERSWRTGLRRQHYGNCFMICGVLYAVDSIGHAHANVSYAFDTHTQTQMVPSLALVNNYMYTVQIEYNPKERVLYGWDNGHQVTYEVKFAY
ncbi:olfactomedin-like protein 2A isoform X2 [Denticeps clupeoides]|uniref:olfactomedin-like protein 2A isoform X2 n=1 Tax=Denticeps clupeoides TaxID=299321 RepID=UPI0010A32894|nr:olfactomedin-like protein 2A isoform X2 [Denticeps clupeoides]